MEEISKRYLGNFFIDKVRLLKNDNLENTVQIKNV